MKRVVGDLEANGLLDEATRIWCGVFKDIDTGEVVKFSVEQGKGWERKLCEYLDRVDILIMHNGISYDLPLLNKLFGYKFKGKLFDTLVVSKLQKPSRQSPFNCPNKKAPHSVEAWGYRVGRGKPEHDDWDNYSPEMLHRCTEDVEIQHLIYNALLEEGKGYDWTEAHNMSFRLFEILHEQEQYGWLVDRPYMDDCIRVLNRWINMIDRAVGPRLPMILEIEESKKNKNAEVGYIKKPFLKSGKYSEASLKFCDAIGVSPDTRPIMGCFTRISFRPVSLDSQKEVKEYLLSQGWIPEEWNTNDKGERTSAVISKDEPFNGLDSKVGRLVAKRIQCVHRRSQIEGWIKRIRPDGRISASVSGLAETGRAKHRNVVNVPGSEAFFGKRMRKCFISKPGYVVVGCDSAGCQNRMLAGRVGDPHFTDILINGKKEDGTSIHQVNQRAIKEIAGLEVSYGKAKALNYAFMFGASDRKLGSIVGESPEKGSDIRRALLSVSAGFQDLVDSLTKEWRSNAKRRTNKWGRLEYYDGWIRGLDGRPIFISSEHQILVYMLQSDEAIMMTAAYIFLYKRAEDRGWKHGRDWGYLIWMHDEFQCEVREDIAEEFAKLAEQCIVDAGRYFKINCPHEGDSSIGRNWGETH